ncbi:uncharacterized protein ACBT44_004352 [Syngnathus typhle]
MPALAVANNLTLSDIPTELCGLNILERHLISKCISFAKIVPLPKGQQRAIRGNVVCVPSEVQETVNVLPRLRNFFQLPPVRQSKPLCVYDPTRLDHWRDDFKKITLTAIMRQKDDVAFAELLNRLRVKEKSDELSEMDRALLATRWMAITLRCWNCFIRTLCRLTRMTTRKTKELAEWQDWRRS